MAFLQSDPPREPFLHAPASVLWLIAAMVVIYLFQSLIPLSDEALRPFELIPARYAVGGTLFTLSVPLVSHMFLHGSTGHLLVNCLWLLAFGPVIARRYGKGLFFAFFFFSGFAGAAIYIGVMWGSTEPAIGASAAIAGLMAAAFRLLRLPGADVAGARLAPVLSRPILIFTGFWIASNVVFALFGGIGEAAAHTGGYLFGLFAIDGVEKLHLARARGRIQT
jgi:membrane associated rhomboid family serine protease